MTFARMTTAALFAASMTLPASALLASTDGSNLRAEQDGIITDPMAMYQTCLEDRVDYSDGETIRGDMDNMVSLADSMDCATAFSGLSQDVVEPGDNIRAEQNDLVETN